jgi:hypothetical protein
MIFWLGVSIGFAIGFSTAFAIMAALGSGPVQRWARPVQPTTSAPTSADLLDRPPSDVGAAAIPLADNSTSSAALRPTGV